MMRCPTCHGLRWTCEDHPELPQNHDGCGGAGVPCPRCNVEEPPRLPGGWTSVARVAEAPGFAINCPECGAATDYMRTDTGPTYIYRCLRHGLLVLPPDGIVRPMPQ